MSTGLGGVFELGLSMDDLDHPTFEFRQARAAKTAKAKQRNKQQPLSTLKEVVAQSIEQRPENVSKASEHQEASEKPAAAGDRTVEPEDEMEQKDSTSSDRTLQRRSTFALKDSDREPTKIEEFPITKSRKELEIEQVAAQCFPIASQGRPTSADKAASCRRSARAQRMAPGSAPARFFARTLQHLMRRTTRSGRLARQHVQVRGSLSARSQMRPRRVELSAAARIRS